MIHQIDQVELPPSANITISKILRGAKASIMADLLLQANMGWVLSGSQPTPDDLSRLGILGWSPSTPKPSTEPLSDPNAQEESTSFVLLAPTDDAFARVNLTQYIHDERALVDLLKLHILPSQAPLAADPNVASRSAIHTLAPGDDGKPLSISDEVGYLTLLSATSTFGDLAFGDEPDGLAARVGIKGAKGLEGGVNDWARLVAFGKASPRLSPEVDLDGREGKVKRGWSNGVGRGGGVVLIGAVLVPYQPGWWIVWGWTILAAVVGGSAALTALGLAGWWLWQKRARVGTDYERLENEED